MHITAKDTLFMWKCKQGETDGPETTTTTTQYRAQASAE